MKKKLNEIQMWGQSKRAGWEICGEKNGSFSFFPHLQFFTINLGERW